VHRRELRATISKLLRLYGKVGCRPESRKAAQKNGDMDEPIAAGSSPVLDPWDVVKLARDPGRPFTLDYINMMLTDFFELRGDRQFGDDPAIVGGVGFLDGRPIVIV